MDVLLRAWGGTAMSDEVLNRVLAAMTEVRAQMTSLQTELISNRESLRKEIKDRLDEFRTDLMAQREPKRAAKKLGKNVREETRNLGEQLSALAELVRHIQTRVDQLEEGRGEGSPQ
jgi:transposase